MQLIIWFGLKWANGKIGEMGEIYEMVNSVKWVIGEIYEMVNSVKWVNGEISEMGEMANSVKSGSALDHLRSKNSQPQPCKNSHAYIFSQLILPCSY